MSEIIIIFVGEREMGLCTKTYGEKFIREKNAKLDFSYCYDYYSYGNNADYVNRFLDSWGYVINHILSGDITEGSLPLYLHYFEEEEYRDEYAENIEEWAKDFVEDE